MGMKSINFTGRFPELSGFQLQFCRQRKGGQIAFLHGYAILVRDRIPAECQKKIRSYIRINNRLK